MDVLDIARALAYKHLGRWTDKYKAEYSLNSDYADSLMVGFLKSKDSEARFATPEELQAISILEEVLIIEECRKTGAAFDILEGESEDLQTILLKFLSKKIITLEKLLSVGVSSVISREEENEGRRELQLVVIQKEIEKLSYDKMSIPVGGKKNIKGECLLHYPKLFTDAGFDHAWKDGVKQMKFRLYNHESYSKTRH